MKENGKKRQGEGGKKVRKEEKKGFARKFDSLL